MSGSGADLNPLNAPSQGEFLGADYGLGAIPGTLMKSKPAAKRGKKGDRIQDPPKTRYIQMKAQLDQDRQSWLPHWRQIKVNFLPYRTKYLTDGGEPNKGTKQTQQIVNNTPVLSVRTCAAGLMSGITNPSRPWIRVKTADKSLEGMPGVKEWCAEVTNAVLKILGDSNFYDAIEPEYREICGFGTMALGGYEIPYDARFPEQPIVNYVSYTIGEYWIGQNSSARVDTFLRQFRWTAKQIVDKFVPNPYDPLDPCWAKISPQVRALWRNRLSEQRVTIYQVIEPNKDYIPGQIGAAGMPVRSVFFEEGGDPNVLLEVKGYHAFPVHVGRWDLNSDDAWGHSPAMECLGDAQSLQVLEEQKAGAIDKLVDPPLIGDANLKKTRVSMLPGDVTWLEGAAVNSYGIKPLYEIKPELEGIKDAIKENEDRVEAATYTDVFQMLKTMGDQLKSGITATEISARQQERLLELGPLLNRLNNEVFDSIVDQVLGIVFRRSRLAWQHMQTYGYIPAKMEMLVSPPPPAMKGKPLNIEYVSILAQAMRMSEIQAMQQMTTYVLSMAQTKPEVLDKLDFDKGIDIIADRLNVPPEFIVSTEQANKVRDIRAKQAQQQQQQAAAQQAVQVGAQAVKNLGAAPLGGSNALQQMLTGSSPVAGNA